MTLIRDYHIGGIVVFARNIQDAAQLQVMLHLRWPSIL